MTAIRSTVEECKKLASLVGFDRASLGHLYDDVSEMKDESFFHVVWGDHGYVMASSEVGAEELKASNYTEVYYNAGATKQVLAAALEK